MALRRQRSLGGWAVAGVALAALTGCAGLAGGPATPVPEGPSAPVYAVGDVFTFEDNGVRVQEQVTGFSGHRAIWQNDRGVTWIQSPDVVSPPVAWSGDPRLGQGNQQVFGEPGKLFPLAAGKTIKFQVAGTSEKLPDGWQAENTCTVVGREAVTVKAGEFQTWRIACQRGEVLETIYYIPEGLTYALRTRERGKEPPYERKELLGVELAQSPDRPMPAARAPMEQPKAEPAPAAAPQQPVMPAPAPARPADQDLAARVARLEAALIQMGRLPPPSTAAPAMAPAPATAPAPPAARPGPAPVMSSGNGRYGAHLGSYRTVDEAKTGWAVLTRNNPDLLGPLAYQTAEFDPGDGRGVFIRLLAGPFPDRASADSLCRSLQGKRTFCRVLNLGPA
jgi:hypothetical protein